MRSAGAVGSTLCQSVATSVETRCPPAEWPQPTRRFRNGGEEERGVLYIGNDVGDLHLGAEPVARHGDRIAAAVQPFAQWLNDEGCRERQ